MAVEGISIYDVFNSSFDMVVEVAMFVLAFPFLGGKFIGLEEDSTVNTEHFEFRVDHMRGS